MLNEHLIGYLLPRFEIGARVVRASELGATGDRSGKLLAISRDVGAEVYLSGVSGRKYLDTEAFASAGIDVRYQTFYHPVYQQQREPFMPCMSAIDLLFTHGRDSADVLRGIGVQTLDHVFE